MQLRTEDPSHSEKLRSTMKLRAEDPTYCERLKSTMKLRTEDQRCSEKLKICHARSLKGQKVHALNKFPTLCDADLFSEKFVPTPVGELPPRVLTAAVCGAFGVGLAKEEH
ncbi:hypothetical protein CDAR_570431 [Caerostris darwini]|uniref:Uncharacterized protein n=1 Tax=Caerostris darwini TaxID=1538125 RepID=A0AAV4TKY6_9ARAC|nr:hypothetical protein CDAR_570431 [Caerostris darwini]